MDPVPSQSDPTGQSPGPFSPPRPGQDFVQWLHEHASPDEATERIVRFHRLLLELTPRVYVVRVIVALNVAVFAIMVAMGAGLLSPPIDKLLEFGANYGPRTLGGEPWRLVTSMFVHIGVIHLAFNMWALWAAGNLLERLVGNVGFAILYLTAGIAGSVASMLWNPAIVSAGASGAVFGVFGGLIGYILLRRDTIPLTVLNEIRNSAVSVVLYNVVFGAMVQGIDNAAHLGGLAAGFLAGLVMSQPLEMNALRGRIWRGLAVATVGAALFAWFAFFPPAAPADYFAEFSRFSEVEKSAVEKYQATVERLQRREIGDAEFAGIVADDVLPPWREATERLANLKGLPPTQKDVVSRLVEYGRARGDGWQLMVDAVRQNNEAKAAQAMERLRAAEAIIKQFSEETKNKKQPRRFPF